MRISNEVLRDLAAVVNDPANHATGLEFHVDDVEVDENVVKGVFGAIVDPTKPDGERKRSLALGGGHAPGREA